MREALLEELAIALRHLQNLDPPGIGARSAKECLTLQLECLPPSATRKLALRIVAEHLEHLAARDFTRIKKSLGCDDDQLRPAQDLIRSLNEANLPVAACHSCIHSDFLRLLSDDSGGHFAHDEAPVFDDQME